MGDVTQQSGVAGFIVDLDEAYTSCRCRLERLARTVPAIEGAPDTPIPGYCRPEVGVPR
ncbi:MAG: hypothetical protein AAF556_04770 [Pseudomonadota bacterium]